MTAPEIRTDHRRYRLATNDNETVIEDDGALDDVEGHRLAGNDNEIVIDDAGRDDPASEDDQSLGMRRARR